MTLSPLHIAIIAKQENAIRIILESIKDSPKFENMIREKTKIDFDDGE